MARITIEDCLQQVNNRFALIHMAAKRVRQLRKGDKPLVRSKDRDYVIALREIAAGKVVVAKQRERADLPEPRIEDKILALTEELKKQDQTHLIERAMENESDRPDTAVEEQGVEHPIETPTARQCDDCFQRAKLLREID